MSEKEIVSKVIKLFGQGPTYWIAEQVNLTDAEVRLIHTAYLLGVNTR